MTRTRQGCRWIFARSIPIVIVVICGGLALLTYSGASAHAYAGSADCFLTESRAPVWTAESQNRSQRLPSDNNGADDTDVDERDFDRDDDDDRNDESASALTASIDLTADHAGRWRVIESESGAHAPAACEAHSLRGPPSADGSDSTSSLDHDSDSHRLRAPPHSIAPPDQKSRARSRIELKQGANYESVEAAHVSP